MKLFTAGLLLETSKLAADQTLCPNIHHNCYRKNVNPRDSDFKCWTREAYGWSCDVYAATKLCREGSIDVSRCDYNGKLGGPESWESCMMGGSLVYPTDDYAPECWKYTAKTWRCKRATQNTCQKGYVNIKDI